MDHALATIEQGEEDCPPPPQELLARARLAAREGIAVETLYRRYMAGQAVIVDFLVAEAERQGATGNLQRTLRAQAHAFDQLLDAIAAEHAYESQRRQRTQSQRRAEQVERLLRGELTESSELAYDLDAHHLGLIAKGPGAEQAIRAIATELECTALTLRRAEGVTWAWLGSRRPLDPTTQEALLRKRSPSLCAAIGEPAQALAGWRLTHRQAKAAFRVAQSGPDPIVRYAEVALLAAALQDELLSSSLRELYLQPLIEERDEGKAALETLRAYFQTARNVSSAAALLGVSRRAVGYRLRAIGKRLESEVEPRASEIELAVKLEEIEGWGEGRSPE